MVCMDTVWRNSKKIIGKKVYGVHSPFCGLLSRGHYCLGIPLFPEFCKGLDNGFFSMAGVYEAHSVVDDSAIIKLWVYI